MTQRRILAVRADSLGDVVLMGPAVRALARDGTVTMLAGPTGAPAAERLPGVECVLVERLPWIDADPQPVDAATTHALVDAIAAGRFDEAVVFTSFHQSPLPTALLLRLAGVPRVGAISDDYPGSLLDVRHHVDDRVHEVERACSLAAALGHEPAPDDDRRLALVRRTAAAPRVALPEGDYVVVHPGASVPARAWEPARHRALVARLVAAGHRVVVTGGPRERELTREVAAAGGSGAVDAGGETDLDSLLGVLAGATVVVVGNTGPAHLAAAVGTPVVSLFAPTVPASRWAPWGVPHVVLGMQDIGCAGCRARACPVPGHPCLDVSTDDVVAAVERLAAERLPV